MTWKTGKTAPRRLIAALAPPALAAATLAGPAAAERVCVESLAGVCLKYEAAPAPSAPPPPPEAAAERALRLTASDRREVQIGLRMLGHYDGEIDGLIGPGSRRAIAAWQRAQGLRDTGYLNGDQVDRLTAAAAPPSQAPAPQVPAPQIPAPPAAAATAPAPAPQAPATDPVVGRTYSHKTDKPAYVFSIDLTVASAEEGALRVRLLTARAFAPVSQRCAVPLDAPFECVVTYRTQSEVVDAVFAGTLPTVRVSARNTNETIAETVTLW